MGSLTIWIEKIVTEQCTMHLAHNIRRARSQANWRCVSFLYIPININSIELVLESWWIFPSAFQFVLTAAIYVKHQPAISTSKVFSSWDICGWMDASRSPIRRGEWRAAYWKNTCSKDKDINWPLFIWSF